MVCLGTYLLLTFLGQVSEKARVPLYSMSAGSLGTSAQEVEAALSYAFELCQMWNAMLLLDEADIFLSARTTARAGPTSNDLVSGTCFFFLFTYLPTKLNSNPIHYFLPSSFYLEGLNSVVFILERGRVC